MKAAGKAALVALGLWGSLAGAAWYASSANAQRDIDRPRLWATSSTSGQTYDVFEIHERGGFAGFDLEGVRVRFSDCTPPPRAEDEQHVDCLDAAGKRWTLIR